MMHVRCVKMGHISMRRLWHVYIAMRARMNGMDATELRFLFLHCISVSSDWIYFLFGFSSLRRKMCNANVSYYV